MSPVNIDWRTLAMLSKSMEYMGQVTNVSLSCYLVLQNQVARQDRLECLARWCSHGPLTRYVKLQICRECQERFPLDRQKKSLVSDPGMHHGTCLTPVSWCMPGSLTRGGGENVPGNPGTCATTNFTYLARGPCRGSVFHIQGLFVSRTTSEMWIPPQ